MSAFQPLSLTPGPDPQLMPQSKDLASIVKGFLLGIAYEPPKIHDTNKRLEADMRAEMDARKIHCDQLERTLHMSASLIEMAYHESTYTTKKNMALGSWYLFYVDDVTPKDPFPASVFAQRFLSRQPQLDPVLDALAEVLLLVWDLYDPLCANSIVDSVFQFVTSCCIEREVGHLPLIRDAQRFPWFLREGTGLGAVFAFMVFPKTLKVDIMAFIQCIPDLKFWIIVSNDLLSFHKEELAGDEGNYVHTRAYMEEKTPLQVLAEMADELRVSAKAIVAVLSHSPDALKAWKTFERGYVLSAFSAIFRSYQIHIALRSSHEARGIWLKTVTS